MQNQVACLKRRHKDLRKLRQEGFQYRDSQEANSIDVVFRGPKETAYEDGVWTVLVYFPENYPFKSPSIGFKNKIFHPNIDWSSGAVCLDVINQTWSPMFQLVHIFEVRYSPDLPASAPDLPQPRLAPQSLGSRAVHQE